MKTLWLSILCSAILLLGGCGTEAGRPGGGRSAEQAEPVRFSGSVSDLVTRAPIADAVVEIQVGDELFTEHTDNSGQFNFAINVDDDDLPDWTAVAVYVDDDSFLPEAVFYADLESGDETADVDIELQPALTTDLVLRRSLTHLGDDAYSGLINSQLQAPAFGNRLTVEFELTADRLAEGGWLTVTMDLRGAQCVGADGNLTWVSRAGELPPDGDPRLLSLGISTPDGNFETTGFTWDLSPYTAGDQLEFVVTASEGCSNQGNRDDFEFVEVVGEFHS